MLVIRSKTIFIPKDPGGVHEILLQSAQWFQRRSRLKLWTDGRRTEPAYTISSPEPSAKVS